MSRTRSTRAPLLGRRAFLADMGLGFGGLALGAMLFEDGFVRGRPIKEEDDANAVPPKAKSVIWIFLLGGASHLETFDPKPALHKYAGLSIAETPHAEVERSPQFARNINTIARRPNLQTKLLAPQVGFAKRGQSGIEVSDWLPNLGACVDDLAVIRSLWTTDFSHSAQLEFNTGRTSLVDGRQPCLGSWVHYGLGTADQQLPRFVVLGRPPSDFGGGHASHQASYLGPQHDGVRLEVDPARAVPYPPRGNGQYRETQKAEYALIDELNRHAAVEHPSDPTLQARIKSYELAFRMQTALPDLVGLQGESRETERLYGLDDPLAEPFGRQCLVARRLVERGVQFVQLYHGGSAEDDNGLWDSHNELRKNHAARCAEVDKPVAGLLKDLKRRGLLDTTLVVWATEFGRAPNVEPGPKGENDTHESRGRDHHVHGFSAWLAGGGVKGGVVHGATDELGFHAAEQRHYVTDIHATVLHLLGVDARRLEIPGRRRLDLERGQPILEIVA